MLILPARHDAGAEERVSDRAVSDHRLSRGERCTLLGVEVDGVSQNCPRSEQARGIVNVGVGLAAEVVLDDFAFRLGFGEVRLDDGGVLVGKLCRAREEIGTGRDGEARCDGGFDAGLHSTWPGRESFQKRF